MTARDICAISHNEKTKVRRAIAHLEREGLLARSPSVQDRRAEILSLTANGLTAFVGLGQRAVANDKALRKQSGAKAARDLIRRPMEIVAMRSPISNDPDD